MQDPWKYAAFPFSALSAYFIAEFANSAFSSYAGLSPFNSKLVLLAATGLIAGFLVDELLPAYIEKVRGQGGGGMGGGGGDDFDFGDDSGGGGGGDFDFE